MQRGVDPSRRRGPTARPQRHQTTRTLSATPTLNGRTSPADSITSKSRSPMYNAGTKRKEREFDHDLGEETNINVVVRCRGRNDREVRENSGVVVSTNGIKSKTVELIMGTNSLSNKTYHFDRVFSPAADQTMIFTEVVAPILDEVISGFNCTIFAYGQTGTGKTYTMSGDISDMLPLPDESGIIPRVLHSLFRRLGKDDTEYAVKCSFIELYNEELRDLLAPDDNVKLKIFDDASRKSHGATLVQGVEESYIRSASKGLELLRIGSHKRQVAATKCNDLSSRSHTVFTITVYIKRPTENGEDFVSAGKLNLVDLAGSENIQRSGAENKRAAEAGLINKSLLTLGRVINALVDKSSHIPYRESKLTRLLQDSLGGRTKTCIIATLSPAKSNLEETISTLDYAFRAKNIRNKPQMNQTLPKRTLFREYTVEIEKLKGELIAARQRNGVYLTPETYEEITTESESRRILTEEQKDKIESMEINLRNKTQELFALTGDLNDSKKSHEVTAVTLRQTKGVLEQTDIILKHTEQSLREEEMLRLAHQKTEQELQAAGHQLLSTLGKTTIDIEGLHNKLRRRSALHALNRTQWAGSQAQVSETAELVEQRLIAFESEHKQLLDSLASRVASFVTSEVAGFDAAESQLTRHAESLTCVQSKITDQTSKSHDEMIAVIEEVNTMRGDVKEKVGHGLHGLSDAAQRIAAGVLGELDNFHTQLHASYNVLGEELKTTFQGLVDQVAKRQKEVELLRARLAEASEALTTANTTAAVKIQSIMAEEKKQKAEERRALITQLTLLIENAGEESDKRLDRKLDSVKKDIDNSTQQFSSEATACSGMVESLAAQMMILEENILKSKEEASRKVSSDLELAENQNATIKETTRTIHQETVTLVDEQVEHMDAQLRGLDDVVDRLKTQSGRQHDDHVESLDTFQNTMTSCFAELHERFHDAVRSHRVFEAQVSTDVAHIEDSIEPARSDLQTTVNSLRDDLSSVPLAEYTITGQTPQKTSYVHPTSLPRTEDHNVLLDRFRHPLPAPDTSSPSRNEPDPDMTINVSPTKSIVYADNTADCTTLRSSTTSPELARRPQNSRPMSSASNTGGGLREIDINIPAMSLAAADAVFAKSKGEEHPPLKRQNTGGAAAVEHSHEFMTKTQKRTLSSVAEGRENQPLNVSIGTGGRRALRNRTQH